MERDCRKEKNEVKDGGSDSGFVLYDGGKVRDRYMTRSEGISREENMKRRMR